MKFFTWLEGERPIFVGGEYAWLWEPIGVSRKKYRPLPKPKILRYKFTPLTENEERGIIENSSHSSWYIEILEGYLQEI